MTILSSSSSKKNKGSGSSKGGSGGDRERGGVVVGVNNGIPCNEVDHGGDQGNHMALPIIPQPDSNGGQGIWSQGSQGRDNQDKRASQGHQESSAPHPHHGHGIGGSKRRHRASPYNGGTRTPKHSRLEHSRDNHNTRSATSSPNLGLNMNMAGSSSHPHPLPSSPAEVQLQKSNSSSPIPPDVSYNSEDEYESQHQNQVSEEEWAERERRFEKKMRKKGFIIKKMGEDGACLFRAVADQVYGDQEMHGVVRNHCMDYIAANADYFSQYVTEDFNHYVNRKRLEYVHGNHIEIQAMSEMYNRTIEVFCYSTEPINTFHGANKSDNEPIRLSYHRGVHYNSLVDPYKATIGVGLGLPGHIPGLADKNIVKEATRQNEDVLIEQAMLEDKLRATDWEATNEALEEQVARESYLQWLKDNEKRNRTMRSSTTSATPSATCTSSSSSEIRSPRHRSQPSSNNGSSNISPVSSPFRGDTGGGGGSFRNSPSRLSPPPLPGPSRGFQVSPPRNGNSPPQSPRNGPGGSTSDPLLGGTNNNNDPSSSSFQLLETSSFINQLPPELFGMNEWEDAGVLAQVLAASQQEYLDGLKRCSRGGGEGSGGTSSTSGGPSSSSSSSLEESHHQDPKS